MKIVIRSAMIALAISMFALTGAYADTPQQEVNKVVQEAAQECATGQITVTLNDGVATLGGNLDCTLGKVAAEQAAMKSEHVTKVINLITVK